MIHKYVNVDPDAVQINLGQEEGHEVLELSVALPEKTNYLACIIALYFEQRLKDELVELFFGGLLRNIRVVVDCFADERNELRNACCKLFCKCWK